MGKMPLTLNLDQNLADCTDFICFQILLFGCARGEMPAGPPRPHLIHKFPFFVWLLQPVLLIDRKNVMIHFDFKNNSCSRVVFFLYWVYEAREIIISVETIVPFDLSSSVLRVDILFFASLSALRQLHSSLAVYIDVCFFSPGF